MFDIKYNLNNCPNPELKRFSCPKCPYYTQCEASYLDLGLLGILG